ncbi:MAG: hypothetical protein AAF938_30300, partial [Myxococcota bacterium]
DGDAISEGVEARLQMPSGASYLGGISEARQVSNQLVWSIPSLAPGAKLDYQFDCVLGQTGDNLFAFDCRGSAAGETRG